MKHNTLMGAIFTFALVSSAAFLAAQQPGQEKPVQKGQMTGNMSMGGMMKECHEHHQAMTKDLEAASKALDGAKQSNDPAKMRAGIDQAQKQLADMKEHMNMCGNMMNMMNKMQGMGGMKGESK